MSSKKSVKEFALIGFLLLAVLFGFQIMTFVFGSLASVDQFDDASRTTINESAWLNQTPFIVSEVAVADFSGGFAIIALWNATSSGSGNFNQTILLANATYLPEGSFTSTDFLYNSSNITVSYTNFYKTEAEMVTEETTNQSLRSIGKYAEQSGTQFTTLGIAITLIILVAVFLFFWQAFMGKKKESYGFS